MAVLNDRKYYKDTDADDEAAYFDPVFMAATDYYPFGYEMPGRKYNFGDYRYGFNGKENDSDGEFSSLTHYDYGFRIYNPAIGRFLSVDPLTNEYPELTPYQFASNTPIQAIDLDGLELLDADEAMLNITSGGVFLKLSNFSRVTKNQIALHNKNVIDLETETISSDGPFPTAFTGSFNFAKFYAEVDIARNGLAGPMNTPESRPSINRTNRDGSTQTRRQNPNRGGGNSRQRRTRRRQIERSGNVVGGPMRLPRGPKGAMGKGLIPFILGATEQILVNEINSQVNEDYQLAASQFQNEYLDALNIVSENYDIITETAPALKTNSSALGTITNFIFQGEFGDIEFDSETIGLIKKATLHIILSDDRVNFQNKDNLKALTE